MGSRLSSPCGAAVVAYISSGLPREIATMPADSATVERQPESRPFEADVSKLLHMMVHSVYSDKDVFLRELISNAADACERLRYEAIAHPEFLGDDHKARITLHA